MPELAASQMIRDGILEFVPGTFRLGGYTLLDGTLTWYNVNRSGITPVNAYVIREKTSAIIIDTGPAAHRKLILHQLKALLSGVTRIGLVLTRIVEFDSQGNAAAILERFPVVAVYSNLPAHFITRSAEKEPLPFGPAEITGVESGVPWTENADLHLVHAGSEFGMAVDQRFDGRFVVTPAPLRLLSTSWIYDRVTRTLFSSDCFTQYVAEVKSEIYRLQDVQCESIDIETTIDHVQAKFAWVSRARLASLRDDLQRITDTYEVVNIAPGFGRIISGAEAVTVAVSDLIEALTLIERARGA